jgi:hypothetical protein
MTTPTTDVRNVLKHLHYLLTFKGEWKYLYRGPNQADNTDDPLFYAKSDLPPHGTTPNNLSAEAARVRKQRPMAVGRVSQGFKQEIFISRLRLRFDRKNTQIKLLSNPAE